MSLARTHAFRHKGRMQLSISQEVLDRIEPLREEINFSAEAERLFVALADRAERQNWVERNARALCEHGEAMARTGLAGAPFDRI